MLFRKRKLMQICVIMQNDDPKHVVHVQGDDDRMRVELYCDANTVQPDPDNGVTMEYWWSREFTVQAPEDLEAVA